MLTPEFPHLRLIHRSQGLAQLEGGGTQPERVAANLDDRPHHANTILAKFQRITSHGTARNEEREENGLPTIAGGTPFLLQIPDEDDRTMYYLAEKLGLEIIAEYDDGYLIVASQDLQTEEVLREARDFSDGVHGTGAFARILEIDDDPSSEGRLRRILGEELWLNWPFPDDANLTLDISIETAALTAPPTLRLGNARRPQLIEQRKAEFAETLKQYRESWEEKRMRREDEVEEFARHYQGSILSIVDDSHVVEFPDSFSVRLRMNGLGFKDLILNYPSLFEVVIPDDIDSPVLGVSDENEKEVFDLVSPDEESPIVCVIDSGVQEGHRWLSAAILPGLSRCFVPQCGDNDIADYVPDGGHGTRVAGAVLYPNQVPKTGTAQAPFWITNARVLDKDCRLKESVFPPELFRTVVNYFSSKGVRIFNHSVAANCACRTNRMSAWATSIDDLSFSKDALVIQAAGNLRERSGVANQPGILDHLEAGRPYPRYLYDPSSRIANPAQSLQALTVGSIAGNFRG